LIQTLGYIINTGIFQISTVDMISYLKDFVTPQ